MTREKGSRRGPKLSRAANVDAGVTLLEHWMEDQVVAGLWRLREAAPEVLDMARRLQDHQARGLSRRVRRLTEADGAELLGELGELALLAYAWRHRSQLSAAERADVEAAVGLEQRREQALAHDDRVRDRWLVLGQADAVDDEPGSRLTSRRTWLRGSNTGREALILQFSAKDQPFDWSANPGELRELQLAFWPSAWPLRALIQEEHGPLGTTAEPPPGFPDLDALLDHHASVLAAAPWTPRVGVVLRALRAAPLPTRGSKSAVLVDRMGRSLPVISSSAWSLLALSGGWPIDLVAEWDGDALHPLAAWVEGGWIPC